MSDGRVRSTTDGEARHDGGASIDELLDRAVAAINRGDRVTGTALAGQVLVADSANAEAEDLLAAPSDPGEIRRLTIFFADLVDSTVLSTRVEPETYRLLVGRYREQVLRAVHRYEGHIGNTAGNGLLAVFGYPIAHEDDVRRAVHAGLEITWEVGRLSEQATRRLGIEINVRVGVHRGLVYPDTAQGDVYGLAANLAARISGLAPPGALVVSEAVKMLTTGVHRRCARTATELLIETGCAKAVSIRSVAERAGVTSPSIYLHFADKDALLDVACADYFKQLDGQMLSAAAACTTPVEVLHALGTAYVRFALKTPVLYRIATMGEPRSSSAVDVVLASLVFVHLRAVVQQMIDDGIYPPRDPNSMAFELWTAVHGIAALFIAKPSWSLDDAEEVTYEVLRAMCSGLIAAGRIGHNRSAGDAIDIL